MSTQTVTRRTLSYASLQDVVDDASRLTAAGASTTGGWTKGQIFEHLARTMDFSLDGFPFKAPWLFRMVGTYYYKSHIFKNGMSPGFKLKGPFKRALEPVPIDDQVGLEHLQKSVQRMQSEEQRYASPIFGEMTRDEWDLLHRRHAELHMSFIAERKLCE